MKTVPPLPDCRICKGTGLELGSPCECTMVCQCGEERPNNLETCRNPGCTNTGCDACDEVVWCCDEHDEDCGDYFCMECSNHGS